MTHTPTDAMIEAAWETLRSAMIPTPRFHDKNCWKQATKDVLQAALAQQQPSGEVVGWIWEAKYQGTDDFIRIIGQLDPRTKTEMAGTQIRNVRPVTYADTTAWNANMDEAPRDAKADVMENYALEMAHAHPRAPDSPPDHIPDAGKMVAPEGEGLVGELAENPVVLELLQAADMAHAVLKTILADDDIDLGGQWRSTAQAEDWLDMILTKAREQSTPVRASTALRASDRDSVIEEKDQSHD